MTNSEDDFAVAIAKQTNKQIDAKLRPVLNLIIGLELAIANCLNILRRRQVLTLEDALTYIDLTIEGNEGSFPAETLMVLQHIRGMLESSDQHSPEAIRETFRVILGGLSKEPPPGKDQ